MGAWLKRHPGVEVVSRDRAVVYAEGATVGAPQAKQVADRWHLLRNLGEAMERLTAQHSPLFRQVAQSSQAKTNTSDTSDPLLATRATPETPKTLEEISKVSRVEQRRLDRSAQREAIYHQVEALREKGASLESIARQTGISTRTVQRYAHCPTLFVSGAVSRTGTAAVTTVPDRRLQILSARARDIRFYQCGWAVPGDNGEGILR